MVNPEQENFHLRKILIYVKDDLASMSLGCAALNSYVMIVTLKQ